MFPSRVKEKVEKGLLPSEIGNSILNFYRTFVEALEGQTFNEAPLDAFLQCVVDEVNSPFTFKPYHAKEREPFDYYQMGLDFFRPLVIDEQCRILGEEQLNEIEEIVGGGENVVLFANHQAEPDPQAISLLLEKKHPKLAEEMIFVAGHRVVTDPMTIPFSRGRNLLCIYSKRYMDHPPEEKERKQQHNQDTMRRMGALLAEGGKCIYVAPSGGRDRPGTDGKMEIASLDPQSIEMFNLIAKQSGRPTHFFPMSLYTYPLLPPPNAVQTELGEERTTKRTPIHLAIGNKIDMQDYPGSDSSDKREHRAKRAEHIWNLIKQGYEKIA